MKSQSDSRPETQILWASCPKGTSGDLWWGDYSKTKDRKPFRDMPQFAGELADLAKSAIDRIEYHDHVPVVIAEQRLTLNRRTPNEKRLAWARRMNELRGDRLPQNRPEVYAQQAVFLHENPTDEVVIQAIRIGDLGITGMPNEVYGLTGLKLKRRSPLEMTFNISLANGACGYIPPPEQHALGGYNTWPARTAGLEEAAEPKIVSAILELLEQVVNKPRKNYVEPTTKFSRHIAGTKPYAFWRFAEMEQTDCVDASGNGRTIRPSGFVAYHLPGRIDRGFGTNHDSHAIQLAGGKLVADNLDLGESYSVQMSFYVGTPMDFRETTGSLISRGTDRLFVTGNASKSPGRIAFGDQVGRTPLSSQTWHHLIFIRNGDFVEAFLDGQATAEFSARVTRSAPSQALTLGGDSKNSSNLEGKFDEVSVYDRALTKDELNEIFAAAGLQVEETENGGLKSKPLDVKTSMQRIHVREGYRIELVASEPMVVDPVAIDWGADGKLWVAEMADYPMGMDGNGAPGGRIRFLEDTDGDGRYDKSTLFAKNIGFPNGIMAWRNGVLVTAAPEVFYAEDTDGDGKADRHETLFSGFMTGNQQLRVNGLRWGLDNLVHCASGAHHAGFGSGNSIFSTKLNASIRLGSRDFRFDPDTGKIDPQSGPSQFGRVRNDFGDWFGVQNSQPLWHYVLADHDMRRNKDVRSIDPRKQVRIPRMPEVFSAKPPQRRFHGFDHAGHYTSACGIAIYRDDLLFPRKETHAFTCEPFHNLVQHHVLEPSGTSYLGERGDDGPIDFFASSDRWTRPVMARTGPDGALWIVDMYRYMIEHPQWLPKEGQEALRSGYRAGDLHGRIYRVLPQDQTARPIPSVAGQPNRQVIQSLQHSNGIVRDMAHRELRLRGLDNDESAEVRAIVVQGSLPETRTQALSLLSTTDDISTATVRSAVRDEHPSVRRQAIRVARHFTETELVSSEVLSLASDSNPMVRLQLASTIGAWSSVQAGEALATLASRTDNDVYTNAAIVSSLPQHYELVSGALAKKITNVPDATMDALLLMGESRPTELAHLLDRILSTTVQPETQYRVVARWLDSMAERRKTLASLISENEELASITDKFVALMRRARKTCSDSTREIGVRAMAISLLGHEASDLSRDIKLLSESLSSVHPMGIQAAAMSRLTRISHPEAANVLISHWTHFLPKQQQIATAALLARPDWTEKLLDAIQKGTIKPTELSLAQQQSLRRSNNRKLAQRADVLLGKPANQDREKVIRRYAINLIAGNPSKGRRIFDENCRICHAIDRQRKLVGPDLRSLTQRSRDSLLSSILAPSRAVEPKYVSYSVVLKNGETLSGVIAEEGEGSVTLVDSTGKSRTILRSSIELAKRSPQSMMPAGFETKISPTEMSHLLAFLQDL